MGRLVPFFFLLGEVEVSEVLYMISAIAKCYLGEVARYELNDRGEAYY